jgi:hypothetical protein
VLPGHQLTGPSEEETKNIILIYEPCILYSLLSRPTKLTVHLLVWITNQDYYFCISLSIKFHKNFFSHKKVLLWRAIDRLFRYYVCVRQFRSGGWQANLFPTKQSQVWQTPEFATLSPHPLRRAHWGGGEVSNRRDEKGNGIFKATLDTL